MRFKVPFNNSSTVRLFDEVKTQDDQYIIKDVGLEYKDGSIDSIAVGGSFATAKGWFSSDDKSKKDDPKDSKGGNP